MRNVEFYGDLYGKVVYETYVSDRPEDAYVIHETLKRIDEKCRNVIAMPQMDECIDHQQLSSVIVGNRRVLWKRLAQNIMNVRRSRSCNSWTKLRQFITSFFHDMALQRDTQHCQQEYDWIGFTHGDYYSMHR